MLHPTDDRWIRDNMTNKDHANLAQRFIGKMGSKLKKSGITSKDRSRIYWKMKKVYEIKEKFKSGKGLSKRRID